MDVSACEAAGRGVLPFDPASTADAIQTLDAIAMTVRLIAASIRPRAIDGATICRDCDVALEKPACHFRNRPASCRRYGARIARTAPRPVRCADAGPRVLATRYRFVRGGRRFPAATD